MASEPEELLFEPDVDEVEPPKSAGCRWGPWATIGLTLLCILVLIGVQVIVLIIYVAAGPLQNIATALEQLNTAGNFLAASTLASTPAVVGLVALFVWLRGCPIREYLALNWPPGRSMILAFVGLMVLLGATDLTSYVLGRPIVPEVMIKSYLSAWVPGFLFALVVLAPLGEETLFRGFLYKGIAESRAGPIVAILVSSIGFAVLHVQYDLYGIGAVAAMGLYLGAVRYKTGSVWLTMLLHGVANGFATLEIVVLEHWLK
jgi:membrane protease YdiL (CAAX protease family)